MQIVIDIDDEVREHILDLANDGKEIPLGINAHMIRAIANGKTITQGQWVKQNSVLRCSVCQNGVERYNKYPYCPNCGSSMKEEVFICR